MMKNNSSSKKQRPQADVRDVETSNFNNMLADGYDQQHQIGLGHGQGAQSYSQNASNLVSAQKADQYHRAINSGDNESANLISKAQIHEVIKGINVSALHSPVISSLMFV